MVMSLANKREHATIGWRVVNKPLLYFLKTIMKTYFEKQCFKTKTVKQIIQALCVYVLVHNDFIQN